MRGLDFNFFFLLLWKFWPGSQAGKKKKKQLHWRGTRPSLFVRTNHSKWFGSHERHPGVQVLMMMPLCLFSLWEAFIFSLFSSWLWVIQGSGRQQEQKSIYKNKSITQNRFLLDFCRGSRLLSSKCLSYRNGRPSVRPPGSHSGPPPSCASLLSSSPFLLSFPFLSSPLHSPTSLLDSTPRVECSWLIVPTWKRFPCGGEGPSAGVYFF